MDLIILHPMKTAGTSVRDFLKINMPNFNNSNHLITGTGHYLPDEVLWRFDCQDTLFETTHKISFIRNPYDRLVSFYHHMKQMGGHAEGLCNRWSFEQFAMHPMLNQIMLPCVAYHKYGVDSLIRFEHLTEDVHTLIDTLPFGDTRHLFHAAWKPHDRRMFTKHKPYQEYYNQEMYNYVYEQFKADFDLQGYVKH